ncbi:hypothetical protein KKP04_06055 [Rhodomicrobium sp. Az07]|uniref:hypothetical protein n=1 Tax=Rhodomicrobium sp. Az07 TaxID=2839034 RepID=UPI001BEB336F|nr:hypothetical protein [Rhodomicrobium sp. Az07]MBT3070428.1 hypothetical protein [Rhodomicrobium sp. Az07]
MKREKRNKCGGGQAESEVSHHAPDVGATLHFRQHNPVILRGNRPVTETLQSTSRFFSLTQAEFQLNWRGG